MTDRFVRAGSTEELGRVEGDLRVGRKATIKAESGGRVVSVAGRARFDGPVTIDCGFECRSMRVEGKGFGPAGDIKINGNLVVEESAALDATVKVAGSVMAETLDVAGHLRSGELSSRRLRVGGHLEVRGGLTAEEVDVGGHMNAHGEVKINNLRVGGHAKMGGGSVSGEIRVRGHFSTTKKLAFGHLQTFGNTVIPGGSTGERLSAMGRIEFDGDTSCRELEVTGGARVRGELSAESVNLKGNLDASGDFRVSRRFQVWGSVRISGALGCETLDVGGKLVAERASVADRASIAGEVRTSRGLKARSVDAGRGSKVSGPIFAESVDVGSEMDLGSVWGLPWWRGTLGRPTTVGDVHAGEVVIRARSRAGRIFGRTVELEEGVMAEEVVYTGEVKLPQKYFLTKHPRKVDSLPEPPF